MSRHAAPETWEDRAGRLIHELSTPEPQAGNHHPNNTPGATP